ncbi:MAG: DUF692 domain-containing protein [Deltaproteobacteria bacterium]|nr:DUF692 domain-containing protein [Deltaproteobacteria bacterium]
MKGLAGIGLRTSHYSEIRNGNARVDWFEIISENYIDSGGAPLSMIEKVREDHPIAMHGVSLNIGSSDKVDKNYLKKLKELKNRISPFVISDHLCWGGIEGRHWHDLFPVPMTEEAVKHISKKIRQTQEILESRIALENISTYLRWAADELSETEFTKAILQEADCDLLLDVNNIYVNSFNHDLDAYDFISKMPAERVVQFHLAGHSNLKTFLFDTHDAEVISPVWDLFRHAIQTIGPRKFLVEWDDKIPELKVVEAEAFKAQKIIDKVLIERRNEDSKKRKTA